MEFQHLKNKKVLYAEDEKDVRDTLLMILKNFFNEIDTAKDGEEALSKYKQKNYDLVITDINMPKMNGFDLIENIKKLNKDQKIVIISAYHDNEFLLKAIKFNVFHYILKPISMENLILVLEDLEINFEAEELKKNYLEKLKKEVEEKTKAIEESAKKDALTNAFNIKTFIQDSQNKKYAVAIKIKNLTHIQTTFGFEIFASLLKQVVAILKQFGDIYRISEDTFAFLLGNETDQKRLEKILKHLEKNYNINNFDIVINPQIAVANGDDLLKKLKIAFLSDKKSFITYYKKNNPIEEFQNRLLKLSPLIEELIKNEKVLLYLQPIIDNKTLKTAKYEVLSRLDNYGKIMFPNEFIDILEHTQKTTQLTKVIIKKSFELIKKHNIELSINLGESDFRSGKFIKFVENQLKKYEIDPKKVTFEILETTAMSNIDNFNEILLKLKNLGFIFAIDDFGVSYSNFERFLAVDYDIVKIDGLFVKNILENKINQNIVKAITKLSQSLDLKVVCEYVENEEIYNLLKDLGVDFSQGYYFSKPMPYNEILT